MLLIEGIRISIHNFLTGSVALLNSIIKLGETRLNNNGLKMTTVLYRNASNIEVEFEDGVVVNTRYSSFEKGYVEHPTLGRLNPRVKS